MTTPFSTYFDTSALIAGDTDVVSRDIVVASGAQLAIGASVIGVTSTVVTTVLPRGTVLGRITASDKYIVSIATASDGSQVPACVTACDIDPSAGDVPGPAYFQGEFAAEKMSFDASWTAATLEAAFRKNNTQVEVRSLGVLG